MGADARFKSEEIHLGDEIKKQKPCGNRANEERLMQKNTQPKEEKQEEPVFNTVHELLSHIQRNLSVPKSHENKFGNYKYRNAEDILEGVKKLLPEGAFLTITDDIKLIGERYYVQATAKLYYKEMDRQNIAFAREADSKKGMDESQVTGATSSYARKYALNGLFAIDDTKDADSMDNTKEEKPEQKVEVDKDSCPHEHTAVREVKKEGPNKGKKFKACLDCKSFLGWHTEASPSAQDLASDFMASEEAYRV